MRRIHVPAPTCRARRCAAGGCLALLVLAGCAEPRPARDPELGLEPLAVIGGDVEEGPGAFGHVGDVEMDPERRVYVLDRMAGAVQVYDAGGNHVRTLGGPGEGPGELEEPTAMGWGPDGNLWVVDPRNGRYTVFAVDGTLVSTRARPVQGIAGDMPVTFTADGRLFDVTFDLGPDGPSAVPVELDITQDEVREVERVRLPPLGPWGVAGKPVERDGRLLLVEIPFAPTWVWQIGPRGDLWYGNTGDYEVRRRSADGSETRFTGVVAALPVTDAERGAALDDQEGLDPSMIPATKPPVRGFFVGELGELWVMLREAAGGGRIDVFDPLGARLSTVHAALDPQPRPKVRGGIVLGVARDSLGVERVVRYRIVR